MALIARDARERSIDAGKRIAVQALVVLTLDGGKVARLHGIFDQADLLRQIGVSPSA